MSDETHGSSPSSRSLPDAPNLNWLRKQAKRRLDELRKANPAARLADAQFDLAREYGFSGWRALKSHIDSLTVDGRLFDAARNGDVTTLAALLEKYPDKLYLRTKPYEQTLLHLAAFAGHLAAVELLLSRGLDANARDKGDDTYAMHWAAAGGHLDVVRRLADAGGDVVGQGDDHELEVIGWASCGDYLDGRHRAVADFLVSRGAKHHIFSAISLNLADEVRRIVADDPTALNRPQSRNENYRRPLHYAVKRNRAEMVTLLLDLGADPLATDGAGFPPAAYASSPDTDRALMNILRERGWNEDLFTVLALEEWQTAERLLSENPAVVAPGGASFGVLHLMAKRNDLKAVRWLLQHGLDPNARWSHWDSDVTPLHLAVLEGHTEVARLLLDAGADPRIRDTKHDSDAIGWAEFFRRPELARILEDHRPE